MTSHGNHHSVAPILPAALLRMIHAHFHASKRSTVLIVFTSTTLVINCTVTAREAMIRRDSTCTGHVIIQDTDFIRNFTY